MKRRKASHMLRRLSPALLFLIGGSIIVLTAGSFLSRTITPLLRQSIAPANTPPALAYSILSIQAHQPAAPIISIPPPFLTYVTPTPGGPSSPTPTMTQGTPTSPPVGNPGATLPPGSALPGESACAASITTSSFEPRPDNYAANHRVPTAAQIANLQPWNASIGMDDKSDSLRRQITGNFTGPVNGASMSTLCAPRPSRSQTGIKVSLEITPRTRAFARREHGTAAVATRATAFSRSNIPTSRRNGP